MIDREHSSCFIATHSWNAPKVSTNTRTFYLSEACTVARNKECTWKGFQSLPEGSGKWRLGLKAQPQLSANIPAKRIFVYIKLAVSIWAYLKYAKELTQMAVVACVFIPTLSEHIAFNGTLLFRLCSTISGFGLHRSINSLASLLASFVQRKK